MDSDAFNRSYTAAEIRAARLLRKQGTEPGPEPLGSMWFSLNALAQDHELELLEPLLDGEGQLCLLVADSEKNGYLVREAEEGTEIDFLGLLNDGRYREHTKLVDQRATPINRDDPHPEGKRVTLVFEHPRLPEKVEIPVADEDHWNTCRAVLACWAQPR